MRIDKHPEPVVVVVPAHPDLFMYLLHHHNSYRTFIRPCSYASMFIGTYIYIYRERDRYRCIKAYLYSPQTISDPTSRSVSGSSLRSGASSTWLSWGSRSALAFLFRRGASYWEGFRFRVLGCLMLMGRVHINNKVLYLVPLVYEALI